MVSFGLGPITNETKETPMTPTRRYAHKQAKALKRRRLNAQERHVHQQRQAQRDIEALRQALDDLGLPDDLVLGPPLANGRK